jgi:hypothetical protein
MFVVLTQVRKMAKNFFLMFRATPTALSYYFPSLYNKENKKNVFPTVSLNCRLAILLANPPLWPARCGERLRSEKRQICGSLGPSRPPCAKSPSTSRQNCIPLPRAAASAAMYKPPRPRPEEGRRSQPLPRLGEKRRRDDGTVGTGAEQGK